MATAQRDLSLDVSWRCNAHRRRQNLWAALSLLWAQRSPWRLQWTGSVGFMLQWGDITQVGARVVATAASSGDCHWSSREKVDLRGTVGNTANKYVLKGCAFPQHLQAPYFMYPFMERLFCSLSRRWRWGDTMYPD